MEKVRLGDVATYINGYAFKPSDWSDNGVPIIRIQDLTGNSYKLNRYNGDYDKKYEVNNGDVLISWSASLGIYVWSGEKAVLNQHIFKVNFDKQSVNKNYFVYQVGRLLEKYSGEAHGATMKHLTKPVFDGLPFYLPALAEQKQIADKLDKLTNLINKRKQQLEKLDELVKSRFVEMFGDPETNPFGWNKVSITTVLGGKVSNGFFAKRDDYIDNGNVSVIGVAYVVNRMYSQVDNIPRTNADENAIKKFAVKYGDMLFCRSSLVAEGIGKASIVPENVPENTLFECHVIRLPLDMQQCVPEYMQTLSTMDYFRNQIIAQSKTATMTTIGQDGILKSHIVLPPIEMQKEFYKFIKLVEKSKAETQKGLEKLELLKNELMQKYFG